MSGRSSRSCRGTRRCTSATIAVYSSARTRRRWSGSAGPPAATLASRLKAARSMFVIPVPPHADGQVRALQQAMQHHESRAEALRREHRDAFIMMDRIRAELDHLSNEINAYADDGHDV